MMRVILFSLFLTTTFVSAYEFLYPVAYSKQREKTNVYVLYQKSTNHVELWIMDEETGIASKGLLSSYTPAGLQLLPNKSGFSFIDNGRIRIKTFAKRSPKSIDIYEPVYHINVIHWLDDKRFYMSAKKNGSFCIFQLDQQGIIDFILEELDVDYMYPQKKGDDLFYIERTVEHGFKRERVTHRVVRTIYPVVERKLPVLSENDTCESEIVLDDFINSDFSPKQIMPTEKECIVDFKSSAIAFLHMVSDTQGFLLEHPTDVDRRDKLIPFNYYEIKKGDDGWECNELFQFSVPAHIILHKSYARLYESMLPLLPKYKDGFIYFMDCSILRSLGDLSSVALAKEEVGPDIQGVNLDLFSYDLKTGDVSQKSFSKNGQLLFSPLFVGDVVFYGGIVNYDDRVEPAMWINDDGFVCIKLPSCQVN